MNQTRTNFKNTQFHEDSIMFSGENGIHTGTKSTDRRFGSVLILALFMVCITILVCPVQADVNSTISWGVILPLSGDCASQGSELLQGIECAISEINDQGGIFGRMISLKTADDQGNPDTALSLFREIKEKGIPVVIGSYTTDLTMPLAEEMKNDDSIVLISPQANGQALYGISPGFFQLNAPVRYLGEFVGDWVSYTAERVAIVSMDNEFGKSLTDAVLAQIADKPVKITSSELVSEDTDFPALSRTILDRAPDIVICNMFGAVQIPLLQNLSQAGYRGQVVLTDASLIPTLEDEYGDVLSAFSVCSISSTAATVPGIHTDRFRERYEKTYGIDPVRSIAGYGYDSVQVLADALKMKGNISIISPLDIKQGLKNTSHYGVTGPKVFDEKNAVRPALDRWVFRNGKFELMSTSYR